MERGYAYVQEDLENMHLKGQIIDPEYDKWQASNNKPRSSFTIDPASLDIKAGDYAWRIDTEGKRPMFVPNANHTIEELIMQQPSNRREKIPLNELILEPHYLYFIPAIQKINIASDERVIATGSSSLARIFVDVRLYADYNPRIDEISGLDPAKGHQQLWMGVQPNIFNLKIPPGLPLTQIIWTKGKDFWLTDTELEELNNHQINTTGKGLLNIYDNETLQPISNPTIRDGLESTLDLQDHSRGIVALQAKNNSIPLDLSKREFYDVEDYFYLLKAKTNGINTIIQEPGIPYIYKPVEVQSVPTTVIAVHDRYDDSSWIGQKEKAGLFNPGNLTAPVYEATLMQKEPLTLYHGMPISRTRFIRLRAEVKAFDDIQTEGSKAYGNQFCITPAKFFKMPEWDKLTHYGI